MEVVARAVADIVARFFGRDFVLAASDGWALEAEVASDAGRADRVEGTASRRMVFAVIDEEGVCLVSSA